MNAISIEAELAAIYLGLTKFNCDRARAFRIHQLRKAWLRLQRASA